MPASPRRSHRPSVIRGLPALALLVAVPALSVPHGPPVLDTRAPAPNGPTVHALKVPTVTPRRAEPHAIEDDHARVHASSGRGLQRVALLNAPRTERYRMVGVTWRPSDSPVPHVEVRVRTDHGWGDWDALHVEHQNAPEGEGTDVREGTAPMWVDRARGVQVRVLTTTGRAPSGLAVQLVDPGDDPTSLQKTNTQLAAKPNIFSRRQWGANESMGDRCWRPIHGNTMNGIVVHHTAGSNSYSRSQSDDIVRGIYAYHTRSNGWCDLGYNFLVDKFGRVFEGRAGGVFRPVRGAHSGDGKVNEVMTGVALMGKFSHRGPTRAMRRGLIRFAAWRMESFYRRPFDRVTLDGSTYPRIAGHRNVTATACPGGYVQRWLPTLRKRVAHRIGGWRSRNYRKWQHKSAMGAPKVAEHWVNGGRTTVHRSGHVAWSRRTGVHAVRGVIRKAWLRRGGPSGWLGYPHTDNRKVRGGYRVNFQRGFIKWRSRGNRIIVRRY